MKFPFPTGWVTTQGGWRPITTISPMPIQRATLAGNLIARLRSGLLLDDLLQLRRQLRNRDFFHLHLPVWTLAHDMVELAEAVLFLGIVVAEVAAAALLACQAAAGDCLGYGQQVVQIERGV